jgi:nucleotide-binding universal stress UspA family protein
MNTQRAMDWIVGIDPTPNSLGALKLARWLHTRSAGKHRFTGVHTVSPRMIPPQQRERWLSERAEMLARASASAVHATTAFSRMEAAPSDAPEDTLRQMCADEHASVLMVGRTGTIEGWSLVSLGRVTRRILRSTPVPVVVVPPDLEPEALGTGPIVVAVTPRDDAVEAARFARRLGRSLDLPPLLLNIEPEPMATPLAAVDSGIAYSMAMAEHVRKQPETSELLDAWVREHDLHDMPVRREKGRGVGPRVLEVAQSVGATMIVCGSRQLSLAERVLQSSVGSDLAARSDRPVVVVPPPFSGADVGV